MAREISDIVRFFQIPNLNHTLLCANAKDDAIRMELRTGQT